MPNDDVDKMLDELLRGKTPEQIRKRTVERSLPGGRYSVASCAACNTLLNESALGSPASWRGASAKA